MIICITPNPAMDRTTILPCLVLGNLQRAERSIVAAGGKGLNVARAICHENPVDYILPKLDFNAGYNSR
jgi:fructose-1-phosphate kinase PfkB-like protein